MKKSCCGPANFKSTLSKDEELVLLSSALGHPARLAIIKFLKKRKACVCGEIVKILPLAQSTVSQHLKVLKNAGWINGEVAGPSVCYCLNFEILERFKTLLKVI
jgi:ArsR family transcriptional regulator